MLISMYKSIYTKMSVCNSSKAAKLSTDEFDALKPMLQLPVWGRVMFLLDL